MTDWQLCLYDAVHLKQYNTYRVPNSIIYNSIWLYNRNLLWA